MFTDEVVAMIRRDGRKMERIRQLTPQILDYIYEQRLFKLFIPDELAGRMTPLPEALRIFEQAAWIDGSFGWLVTVGSGGGFFTPFMQPEVGATLLTPREAVIAGSGYPAGVAQEVDGGYLVRGRWKYCSGANYATIFTANCYLETAEPVRSEIRSMILRPEQVQVITDWDAYGMKGTASHSIVVEDAFVPREHTFSIMERPLAHDDHPVYRYPFLPFSAASFAAVAIGVAKHFFTEARAMTERGQGAWVETEPHRYSMVMEELNKQELRLNEAVEKWYQAIERSWERIEAGDRVYEAEERAISHACRNTAQQAVQGAEALFPYLGMQAIREGNRLNQIWRDLHTACQHTFLSPFLQ